MLRRIIGIIVVLVSLFFYLWHLASQGAEPHSWWALLAGIFLLFGLWVAIPGKRRHRR